MFQLNRKGEYYIKTVFFLPKFGTYNVLGQVQNVSEEVKSILQKTICRGTGNAQQMAKSMYLIMIHYI